MTAGETAPTTTMTLEDILAAQAAAFIAGAALTAATFILWRIFH